jgi:serine/threonine-protein kinase RsbT
MGCEVRVDVRSDRDVVIARQKGRSLATEAGLSRTEATLLATAISEVARNIVQYVGEGEVILRTVSANGRDGVSVVARDCGPGIQNVDFALSSEHSSGGRAGLGLPGARRLMDDFHIESRPGEGTSVIMTKWKSHPDVR